MRRRFYSILSIVLILIMAITAIGFGAFLLLCKYMYPSKVISEYTFMIVVINIISLLILFFASTKELGNIKDINTDYTLFLRSFCKLISCAIVIGMSIFCTYIIYLSDKVLRVFLDIIFISMFISIYVQSLYLSEIKQ